MLNEVDKSALNEVDTSVFNNRMPILPTLLFSTVRIMFLSLSMSRKVDDLEWS